MPDVRVLSFHADYRCRDAGVCCTSNWPIPIETDRHARVQAALANGGLRPMAGSPAAVVRQSPETSPDATVLLATSHGRCVFHDPAGRCAIHSALGHDVLPLACRQFPRVSVIDPRGVSVTLSHYCPTAARGLRAEATHGIVVNPAAFPPTGEYIGLDARTALPPLLRPGMLLDWESWWEIEATTVEVLLTSDGPAGVALGRVQRAVQRLLLWTPDEGPLASHVTAAFADDSSTMLVADANLVDLAIGAIPEGSRANARWSTQIATSGTETSRFLAAHAFANWTLHLGDGLWPWWRSIETAAALIEAGAGVRHADLVLRHLIDPKAFASALSYSAPMNG